MPFIPAHISIHVVTVSVFSKEECASGGVNECAFFSAGERENTASNSDKLVPFYALEL